MLCWKLWKTYLYHLIICRRTICDRKRRSACSKRPKNGCWDVHLSCKVFQQLHIFKEYIRRVNLKYNCCGRVPQTGELEERDIRLDVQVGQAIHDGHCLEQIEFFFYLTSKYKMIIKCSVSFWKWKWKYIHQRRWENVWDGKRKRGEETLRMCRSRQAGFCSHQTSEALRWRRYKVDVHCT